ncbi:Fur family transcriptional regulator [Calidifontibacter terrae]
MANRRPTKQRAAVSELLGSLDDFVTAQELHTKLTEVGQKIGLATVYRTLQALAADGAVDVLRTEDGESAYRRCASDRHHHHLVCRACGRTVEVEGPTVEKWAAAVSSDHGFTEVEHTIEIFGRCADCAG